MEFVFPAEDETLGALLQTTLALDPRVRFVGFRMNAENALVLRVDGGDADGRALVLEALRRIRDHFAALDLSRVEGAVPA
jgi:DNA-directed RNA polymerase subunit L